MKNLTVHLGDRSYPINIGVKLEGLGRHLARRPFTRRALVVTDTNVRPLHLPALRAGLTKAGFEVSVVVLPAGEQHKTLAAIEKIYAAAVSAKLDRRSPLIALGGGVGGDLAGFAAATYLRGLPFIQVPTTLLAMVDSSVGGKTGFDLPQGKNLVGAFYQPALVWVDLAVLSTLDDRQIRNGLAEVIKYGVILDGRFFAYLEKKIDRLSTARYAEIVRRCCALKASVVEKDEREEKGLREVLNYGHTFAHAIETLTGYSIFCHGEAVAIGMNLAARLARRLGMLSAVDERRIEALLVRAGLPVTLKGIRPPARSIRALHPASLRAAMGRDKKVRAGSLRLVLPKGIGATVVRAEIPEKLIREVLS